MTETRLHIFKDEHVYNIALLKLFATEFSMQDHRFIFLTKPSGSLRKYFPGQIVHYPGIKGVLKAIFLARQAKTIYFHSLPMGPQVMLWAMFSSIFKKSVWIYWGADIYAYRNRFKSLKHIIYHWCRKSVIRKIPDIAGFLEGDFRIITRVYKTKARYHQVVYPIPAWFELIENDYPEIKKEGKSTLNVLLGNSASKTNLHLEALSILSRYNQENLAILCPLSYGIKQKSYLQEVISAGKNFFGDRFRPLTEFMDPARYQELLNGTDIAVMNHNRQEALGNIISLLYLGKKVYLKQDTSSFEYFRHLEVKIYTIEELQHQSFEEFSAINRAELEQNAPILKRELGMDQYVKCWKTILTIQ